MEQKTIYLVKYSIGDSRLGYIEYTHSAYENEEDAYILKLDLYIFILNAIKDWANNDYTVEWKLDDYKGVKNCLCFEIDKNKIWVEELYYYTKKQS